jgi:hypothetical protein
MANEDSTLVILRIRHMPVKAHNATATVRIQWKRMRLPSIGLAVLLALAGLKPPPAPLCADEDCTMPCCDHDLEQKTVLPDFPCCRTVTAAQPRSPSTTVGRSQPASPAVAVAVAPSTVSAPTTTPIPARHLPAPPLYHRHCALLL